MLHDGMPYDPIQGQGHEGPKVVKMTDFKVYLLCRCACNQQRNGKLWYSKTTSKFWPDRLL